MVEPFAVIVNDVPFMLPPPTLHVPAPVITNVAVFAVTVKFVRVAPDSEVAVPDTVIVDDPNVNVRAPEPDQTNEPPVMFFEPVLNVPFVTVSAAPVIVTLSANK